MTAPVLRCALFDLDGTLVDTAPDLVGALNELRAAEGLDSLPFESLRPVASHGAAALLLAGFPDAEEAERRRLVSGYLDIYRARIARESQLFSGMDEVLDKLEHGSIRWGVVTNKPRSLTLPLLEALALYQRADCVVSGDDLSERKPHPAPVLRACELCGCPPHQAIYIGDAERDIQAGQSARALTAVALWGYLDGAIDPKAWNADLYLESPREILTAPRLAQSWHTPK